MYRGYKIGVAIPAYNEEKNIGRVLSEIPEFVDRIYVVDDGSTDKTPEIVEEISKKDHRVFLIRHEKNRGKGAATVTGWKIWKKYIVRGNPIGFAYLLGFILILLGVIFVIFANYFLALILGVIFFLIACFFEWGTITAEGVLK